MGELTAELKVRIRPPLSREIDRVAEERDITRSEVARDLLDVGYMIMATSRDIEFSYNLWEILREKVPERIGEIERYIEREYSEKNKG